MHRTSCDATRQCLICGSKTLCCKVPRPTRSPHCNGSKKINDRGHVCSVDHDWVWHIFQRDAPLDGNGDTPRQRLPVNTFLDEESLDWPPVENARNSRLIMESASRLRYFPSGTPLSEMDASAPELPSTTNSTSCISVVSYNLLAPTYVRPLDKRAGAIQSFAAFAWCSDEDLDWGTRREKLLNIL